MKDWFLDLERREQWFVAAGAAVVFVALVWALAWLPLARGVDRLEAGVELWRDSLEQIIPLQAGSGAATPARRTSGAAPVVVIDQTLRARGLDSTLRRSQPTTSTGIRVEFEQAAFDELVVWLGELSRDYGLDVQAANFTPSERETPGRVNASLTLERQP